MLRKKIVIVGNSVALRNRPHDSLTSKNYGQIIEQELNNKENNTFFETINLSFTRATVFDLHKIYPQIVNHFGDLYIINLGSSDAPTREISRWFADYLFSNKRTFLVRFLKGFHHFLIKPKRSLFVRIRGKRSWTSAKVFSEEYEKLLHTIQHNTNGKIICLSINMPNDRLEKECPGSTQNYRKFNQIIQEVAQKKDALFLDLSDLNAKQYYPDGTHFNETGNQEVAQRILKVISKEKII